MAKKRYDWNAVQAYHDAGHGFVECSKQFGFTHTAWIKAIRRGALSLEPSLFRDRRRKYNWSDVQAYYDAGFSYQQTKNRFGFCNAAWTKAVLRREIRPRNAAKSIDAVLGSRSSRWLKKAKLLRERHLSNECSVCGITEWRGQRLAIQIDHINGVKNDWRIENLRMLCPNCHSQTPTYGGLNARRVRLVARTDALIVV